MSDNFLRPSKSARGHPRTPNPGQPIHLPFCGENPIRMRSSFGGVSTPFFPVADEEEEHAAAPSADTVIVGNADGLPGQYQLPAFLVANRLAPANQTDLIGVAPAPSSSSSSVMVSYSGQPTVFVASSIVDNNIALDGTLTIRGDREVASWSSSSCNPFATHAGTQCEHAPVPTACATDASEAPCHV